MKRLISKIPIGFWTIVLAGFLFITIILLLQLPYVYIFGIGFPILFIVIVGGVLAFFIFGLILLSIDTMFEKRRKRDLPIDPEVKKIMEMKVNHDIPGLISAEERNRVGWGPATPEVRPAAIRTLGEIGDKQAVAALLKMLDRKENSTHNFLDSAVLEALVSTKDTGVAEALFTTLRREYADLSQSLLQYQYSSDSQKFTDERFMQYARPSDSWRRYEYAGSEKFYDERWQRRALPLEKALLRIGDTTTVRGLVTILEGEDTSFEKHSLDKMIALLNALLARHAKTIAPDDLRAVAHLKDRDRTVEWKAIHDGHSGIENVPVKIYRSASYSRWRAKRLLRRRNLDLDNKKNCNYSGRQK